VLLPVAIMGPWVFDRISVPSEYACTPNVRLEGDFCGIPMPGIWILFVFGSFSPLLPLPIVLPFISTLLLIWSGERRRWQVFHVIAWGLAAIFSGALLVMSRRSGLDAALWGVWLYVGLAASALMLEVLMLALGRRRSQGLERRGA